MTMNALQRLALTRSAQLATTVVALETISSATVPPVLLTVTALLTLALT